MRLTLAVVLMSSLLFPSLLPGSLALAQNTAGAGGSAGTSAAPPAPPPAAEPAPPAAPAAPAAPSPAPAAAPAAPPAAVPPSTPSLLTPTNVPPPAEVKKPGASGADLTLSPSMPAFGGNTNISTKQAEALTASTSGGGADEWRFEFHGYLRAPLRASFGPPSPVNHPSRNSADYPGFNYVQPYAPGAPAPSGLQLHEALRVPGSNYGAWDFTNTVGGPWTQLNFAYGNSHVTGTVVVDAYNQTDGSYKNLQAQQGIDQVFLTLRIPDAFGDYGGLVWNIGSFPNRYGTAGKYDGGMYETYQFGRTHVSGETLTATFSNLDQMGDWTITLEHGLGAKLDFTPFTNNQNYQIYGSPGVPGTDENLRGAPDLSNQNPDYLPYAGPVPQGSTYLHHAHLLAKYQKTWNFGLHYLFTWTPDDNWDPRNSRLPSSGDLVPRSQGPIQGSIAVLGAEARFTGGEYGDGYISYTHVDGRNVNALAESLEILHVNGGPNLKQGYFGRGYHPHTGIYTGPQNETGTIDNISLQYAFSFGAYARAPEDWWGNGPDLVVTAFGMFTIVDSKAPPIAVGLQPQLAYDWNMSTKKLKFGADAVYTPLSWLGYGVRFDHVRPDMDNAYSRVSMPTILNSAGGPLTNPGGDEMNFSVLSGRLVFRSEFVTHETITLRYARYFLGKAAYPSDYRFQWVPRADANAVELSAAMWW